VTDGFFFAQQTRVGRNAKNPDGTSRCNAAGRSLGRTRAGDGPAGGLAKDTEQPCPVVCVRRDFTVVLGNEWGRGRASRFNASQREQSGGGRSAMAGCHAMNG
jgi:hypothetical protein